MPRRFWTGREIVMLAERYPAEGSGRLARDLGRSEDSVSSFARRCGLRAGRRTYQRRRVRTPSPQKLRDS
jgi:hypothetical protein